MGVKLPMGVKFNRVLATFVGKEPGESGGPVGVWIALGTRQASR
jgi:hypothetical protein